MPTPKYRSTATLRALILISVLIASYSLLGVANAESLAEKYFRPTMTGELLNPRGDLLLSLDRQEKVQRVLVTDLETTLQREIMTTELLKGDKKAVVDMRWIDSRSLLVSVGQRIKGIADIADSRDTVKTLVFLLPDDIQKGNMDIREVKNRGAVIGVVPALPHTVLFARNGDLSKVYRIDVSQLAPLDAPVEKTTLLDGGQFNRSNEIASIEGYALRWFADGKGEVRAVTTVNAKKHFSLWYRINSDTPWSAIKVWDPKENTNDAGSDDNLKGLHSVLPQALGDEEKTFYIVETGADDATELYKYNYQDDSKQAIYQQSAGEIIRLQFDYTGTRLLAVVARQGSEIYFHYLDNQSRDIQEKLRQRLTTNIAITGIDQERRYFSVLASDPESYGVLYRYDSVTD